MACELEIVRLSVAVRQSLTASLSTDKIIQLLGRGMHGNVASAVNTRDDTIVALKVSRGTAEERQGTAFEVLMLKDLQRRAGDTV